MKVSSRSRSIPGDHPHPATFGLGTVTLAVVAILAASAGICVLWVEGSRYAPVLGFGCLFLATLALSLRQRDSVFAFYYTVLFIYTFFTQLAIIRFPRDLALRGPGFAVNMVVFDRYMAFVSLSFVAIWLVRQSLRRYSLRPLLRTSRSRLEFSFSRLLFIMLLSGHLGTTVMLFSSSYGRLSYQDQDPLKGNSLFFGLYVLMAVSFLALLEQVLRSGGAWRLICSTFALAYALVFLAISIRAGQRIETVTLLVGSVVLLIYHMRTRRLLMRALNVIVLTVLLFIGFIFMAGVRTSRNAQLSPGGFAASTAEGFGSTAAAEWSSLKGVVFQDYYAPSLMLAVSIRDHFVVPAEVLRSSAFNLVPFIDYPSMGQTLSRHSSPSGSQGFGYYLLAEGYNVAGGWGFLYNAIVFNLGLALWLRFARSDDSSYQQYMTSVLAALAIYVIRGQGYVFVFQALTSLLPAALLYCLANGLTLRRAHPPSAGRALQSAGSRHVRTVLLDES